MNDYQPILECIAKRPRALAVNISDSLNIDPAEAGAQLAALVAVGDIVELDGFAPNGLKAKQYDFSERFKSTGAYQLLVQKADAANFGDSTMTKVDRAIAFVREKGEATSAELHALLNLKPNEVASSYLAGAVKDGRLNKDGKTWKLGDGTAPAPLHVPKFGASLGLPNSTPGPRQAPTKVEPTPKVKVEPIAAPATARAEPAAPAPAQGFRVGLWSDDTLETQRNGQTVAVYSRAERESLVDFICRTLAPAD